MKQITFKEIKKICGCVLGSNNNFANTLCIWMDEVAEACKNSDEEVYRNYGDLMTRRSRDLYAALDKLGYYDDVK